MALMPSVDQMQRAHSSAKLVALSGVLQRLTATPLCNAEERDELHLPKKERDELHLPKKERDELHLPKKERDELRQLLCGLRHHTARSLDCFVEVSA